MVNLSLDISPFLIYDNSKEYLWRYEMLSTVTTKGQVTIPKPIRDLLNIRPSDKVDFVQQGDRVLLVPVKTLKDLRGSVAPFGNGDFRKERKTVKSVVGKRVAREMK